MMPGVGRHHRDADKRNNKDQGMYRFRPPVGLQYRFAEIENSYWHETYPYVANIDKHHIDGICRYLEVHFQYGSDVPNRHHTKNNKKRRAYLGRRGFPRNYDDHTYTKQEWNVY